MISAILASWLLTQVWSWDPTPNTTSYRLYWSVSPTDWCVEHSKIYFPQDCADNVCSASDIPEPAAEITFFMVVASNEYGESDHGHGTIHECLAEHFRPAWPPWSKSHEP